MKKYPKYKNSGSVWLDDIPAHWQILKGKRLFKRMNRPVRDEDDIITAFRDGTVTLRSNRRTEGFTNSLKEIGYQGIRKGDLVIHAMDAFAGAIGVSDSDGKSTPVYSACRPIKDANVYYYSYLLRLMAQRQFILALAKGIRERSSEFRYNEFADLELPAPPPEEQEAITTFLDRKLEEIARFISNKQKLIALLKEQKTAMINRAVTRGINPDVKLKPSGIKWLGDIPAHWTVVAIQRLSESLQTGPFGSQLHSYDYSPGGIPVINPSHMKESRIVPDMDCAVNLKTWERLNRHALKAGDIVFARRGEMGRCALVSQNEDGWLCGTGSLRMRPRHDEVDANFLVTSLSCQRVADYLSLMSVGATMDNLNTGILSRLLIPLPPIDEQKRIVRIIQTDGLKIEEAIAKAEREIVLIKEYRTALISEAVTGKIDVQVEEEQTKKTLITRTPQAPPAFKRAVLAAEIVYQLHEVQRFGRVKLQKLLYLCEYHAELPEIESNYIKAAAGPFDSRLIHSVESQMLKAKWYETIEVKENGKVKGHKYRPLEKAGNHQDLFERYWGSKRDSIQRIINLLRTKKTKHCEIVATLYAAWNDFMLKGKAITDKAILSEVLDNWHQDKRKIPKEEWLEGLDWLRDNRIIPTGFGKPTHHKK